MEPLFPLHPYELNDPKNLDAFVEEYASQFFPGFVLLDKNLKLGGILVSFLGKDAEGAVLVILTSTSYDERTFLDLLSRAAATSHWIRQNREIIRKMCHPHTLSPEKPPRILLIVPAILHRASAIAGHLGMGGKLEVYEYECLRMDIPIGSTPTSLTGLRLKPLEIRQIVGVGMQTAGREDKGDGAERRAIASPGEGAMAAEGSLSESKHPLTLKDYVDAITDLNLRALCTRAIRSIVTLSRDRQRTFSARGSDITFMADTIHLASIHLGSEFLWLEIGPERRPTGRIVDGPTLETALRELQRFLPTLPSSPGATSLLPGQGGPPRRAPHPPTPALGEREINLEQLLEDVVEIGSRTRAPEESASRA